MEHDEFYDDWKQEFRDFCGNCLNGWAFKQTKLDPDFQESANRCAALEEQIESLLGEKKDLLHQLLDEKNLLFSCACVPNYLQGYRDCLFLLRKLELLE